MGRSASLAALRSASWPLPQVATEWLPNSAMSLRPAPAPTRRKLGQFCQNASFFDDRAVVGELEWIVRIAAKSTIKPPTRRAYVHHFFRLDGFPWRNGRKQIAPLDRYRAEARRRMSTALCLT